MTEKYLENDFSLELPLLISKFKFIEDKLCFDVDGKDTNFAHVYALISFLEVCIKELEGICKGLYGPTEPPETAT